MGIHNKLFPIYCFQKKYVKNSKKYVDISKSILYNYFCTVVLK